MSRWEQEWAEGTSRPCSLWKCELEVMVAIWGCQKDIEAMVEEESPFLLGWGSFGVEEG